MNQHFIKARLLLATTLLAAGWLPDLMAAQAASDPANPMAAASTAAAPDAAASAVVDVPKVSPYAKANRQRMEAASRDPLAEHSTARVSQRLLVHGQH